MVIKDLLFCSFYHVVITDYFELYFQLGLVIDLTNSYRYYTTSDLNKEGIKYVKVSNGIWDNILIIHSNCRD